MKKLSLIVAIALGTLVACNIATAQESSKKKDGKRGMPSAEQRVEQMKKDLNLTDEQVPKVKAVLEDQQKKMQELRSESDQNARRTKMREIMEETSTKLKGILTDEQFKQWQAKSPMGGKKGGERKGKKKSE